MSKADMLPLSKHFDQLLRASLERVSQTVDESGIQDKYLPELEQFTFEVKKDPFSMSETLCGYWKDTGSQRRGNLVINSDGSLMLEIDLICPIPNGSGRWAEMVSVWGRDIEQLRAEITLMPTL